MLKMAFPACRIVACPKIANSCPIENGLDATAHTAGRFGLSRPDGLKNSEDGAEIDVANLELAKLREHVFSHGREELCAVFCVPPFRLVGVEIGYRSCLEGYGLARLQRRLCALGPAAFKG